MQSVIKGMVQVAGSTCRIVRGQPGQYRAKTSWTGRLALG